jgi:hypothetical protein
MKDIKNPNLSADSELESLIDRTLAHDAEAIRARFATSPNAQLTAKLALATASRGLLHTLGGKLALYAVGACVAGSAIYFLPSIGRQPNAAHTSPTPHTIQQPAQQPPSRTEVTERTQVDTKPIASRSKVDSEAGSRQIITSPKHTIQLDEGDDKNIPTITDKHYQPPLK